jgi:purine-cytosine permease-like protein
MSSLKKKTLFTKITDNILVILSIIYLWLLPILGYQNAIKIENYQLALAILAVGIYLSDKIDNLKSNQNV